MQLKKKEEQQKQIHPFYFPFIFSHAIYFYLTEATKLFNKRESHTHSPPRALAIEDSSPSVLKCNMVRYT